MSSLLLMTSKCTYAKYEAAGNDFLLIEDPLARFPLIPSWIESLCDRKLGLSVDGLILLQKDPTFEICYRIFNSDGTEARSCGNGLRCLGQFLIDEGKERKTYRVGVQGREILLHTQTEPVRVCMGRIQTRSPSFQMGGYRVQWIDTGAHHLVVWVDQLASFDVEGKGKYFRHHPRFAPEGVNVTFAERLSMSSFLARTFEKGVEGETLSCGTGAIAVAAVASSHIPVKKIQFPGGILWVEEKPQGIFTLSGPVRFCGKGGIDTKAASF